MRAPDGVVRDKDGGQDIEGLLQPATAIHSTVRRDRPDLPIPWVQFHRYEGLRFSIRSWEACIWDSTSTDNWENWSLDGCGGGCRVNGAGVAPYRVTGT
ncbi:MAG: hypothetical protein QF358_10290 [Arenicellales bacterium]|nr:hypothetical protein [Arenicellales bacterium]